MEMKRTWGGGGWGETTATAVAEILIIALPECDPAAVELLDERYEER